MFNQSFIVNESAIWRFSNSYHLYHGWLSFIICSIGLIFNILNVFVLLKASSESAKETNFILMTLATSDSLAMISYLPYCIHYYIFHSKSAVIKQSSEGKYWSIYSFVHLTSSTTFHTISIWLTVYLAFYRFIYMSKSVDSMKGLHNKRKQRFIKVLLSKSHLTIWLICLFSVIICLPIYLYSSIVKSNENITGISINKAITKSVYIYLINTSELDKISNGFVYKVMFFLQAISSKLIPCCLLIIFISLLVRSLVNVKKNSKKCKKLSTVRVI